jgi:hypothetical protein
MNLLYIGPLLRKSVMFEIFYFHRGENGSYGLLQCDAVYYSGLALDAGALSMGIRFCVILQNSCFTNIIKKKMKI